MTILGFMAALAVQIAEPARDWRATARSDVLAAYEIYAENHPGMKDPTNPHFLAQLAAARDAALKQADATTDLRGYRATLAAFSAGLSDGHAVVFAANGDGGDPVEPLWPAFLTVWRGSNALVYHAGAQSPAPAGSVILSCDGRAAADVIRARLADTPFRQAEAGQWWSWASLAFLGRSGSDPARPQRCTFRLPEGSVREAPLSWTPAPPDLFELSQASLGERTPVGLTEPRPGLFLIGLSTFSPDPAGVKAYQELYAEIDRRRPELLKGKAIVLDLRFNGGGSSEWSREVARRLWGKTAVDARMEAYHRPVRIWWRASRDNVSYMSELEAMIRGTGQTAAADRIRDVAAGMKAALEAGRDFHAERKEKIRGGGFVASDLRAPVYVITHGACASACLDAVDTFKRFPVKLIGAPTSADSTYMEVRRASLPSGQGRIVIPLKAWLHRPRKSGEVYRPDIPMNDADWSTGRFLDRITLDLNGRR